MRKLRPERENGLPRLGRQNNDPQIRPSPDPRTYDYIALHGKRNFADVIKLRILSWEIIPVGRSRVITRVPKGKKEAESEGQTWHQKKRLD